MKTLQLKPGKEGPLKNRHHWIFSGAVARFPEVEDGEVVRVESSSGQFLALAYVNSQTSICGRVISFEDREVVQVLSEKIQQALDHRQSLFSTEETSAYRLINSEGDELPGLVVDLYNGVAVVQIATLGMERLKQTLISILEKNTFIDAIYEKSTVASRKIEGIADAVGWLKGSDSILDEQGLLSVTENGMKFWVDIIGGQKTGFFLDQRAMRQYVRSISQGKKVLNLFSYSGGFSVAALMGGAEQAVSVDASQVALELADKNVALNGQSFVAKHSSHKADIVEWLPSTNLSSFEIVVVDPPAFAKRNSDLHAAMKAYRELNTAVFAGVRSGAIVVSSSCSGVVDETLFQKVLFQAAVQAGRSVQIIGRHRLAEDHPVNIFHPETEYLKSLILKVV